MCTLNPDLGVATAGAEAEGAAPALRLTIDRGASAATLGASLMWERLEDRARLLDGQLRALEMQLEKVL